MKSHLIDTNVLVRFLVENPETTSPKFKGVFSFFKKVEMGDLIVELPDLVIFEAYFVLIRIYKVPREEAAEKLLDLLSFKGIVTRDKKFILLCLKMLKSRKVGLIDAYLLALSEERGIDSVYSYDSDLEKHGLKLLEIR